MTYATTTQLSAEASARQAADQKEAAARTVAVNSLDARLKVVEAWIANQPAPTAAPAPIRVSSVADLLYALGNDSITSIVVANGTYHVSPASTQAADSLWIGSNFAKRTNPVSVAAETPAGVIFDGGGATYFGGISFEEGAHDQTWDGFVFQNGQATSTGCIVFGGYESPAPHHITLRNTTIRNVTGHNDQNDHAVYFSQSPGVGPHDLLIDGLDVEDTTGTLSSALHFFHSDATHQNAQNVTVRNLTVNGTFQALIFWDGTLQNITIDTAQITKARSIAVRYEMGGTVTLKNVVSTGSGQAGFYSQQFGATPPLVTFAGCSLA